MAEHAKRLATYADLEAAPPHLVAEIIHGSLVTHPRPAPRHAIALSALGSKVISTYQWGEGNGPGGWIFVDEPELHLGPHVVVPDLAGWRRERLPSLPETPYFETPPDWVCEGLSPSTEEYDRGPKRDIYAEARVPHLWHLDPRLKMLEVFQLTAGHWLLMVTFCGADDVRAVPFDAISFPLDLLWPLDAPAAPEPKS
jgi:Uma2 family endonuclease